MDKNEKQQYRSNFGATILFSGVQIYQIFIRVVRSKFVAILIGPAGMGITSLLRSTTDLISAATNCGLRTSGVKTIAGACAECDKEQIAKTAIVFRRLILCTGLLGVFLCAALSPVWSRVSFGNQDYIWSFVLVSLVILFDQLAHGEQALLQGTQQKKYLAKANVIGQTVGLLMTIPLYYFFGVKAIVWVLVLSSLLSLTITSYYSRKLKIEKVAITWKETWAIGWTIIKLGIFLSLQHLLSQASVYFVRNIVSNTGGLEEVGLYSAGTLIINMYLGLVFSAIATDYFPRLAATKSNEEMNDAVKKQAEISMLLFAPIIVFFIVFIKPVILLLYSEKFLLIENMLYWAMGATIIKSLGWALSYTVLAKASPLKFFLNELLSMSYSLPIQIVGYKLWGLTGFGVAISVTYVLYSIQMIIVTRKYFGTKVDRAVWKIFALANMFVALTLATKFIDSELVNYIIGSVILCLTAIYAFSQLNKRMDLISALKVRFGKK